MGHATMLTERVMSRTREKRDKFLNELKQLTYTQKLAQRLFLFNYVRILNSTFILLLRKKKHDFPDL